MSQIYKLNHIEGDDIKHIYIFSNDDSLSTPEYIDSYGHSIFSDEEIENINRKNIPIDIISSTVLHGDDTIGMIKKKIVHALHLEVSTKELYLFGIIRDKLNSSTLYKQLTHNETLPLTQELLCKVLLNIVENGCTESEVSATCDKVSKSIGNISYDDFLNILDWDSIHSYTVPIGERLVGAGKTIPYIVNPYNCISIDQFIKENMSNIVTTQNTNLLFEAGNLCLNNIFFCLANEVLTYTSKQSILAESDILNLYFPLLVSMDKITTLSELNVRRQELYDKEERVLGDDFVKYNQQVNMFYDIYKDGNVNSPLNYLHNTPGITAISIIVHPIYEIKFPLEILFKLIHSTHEIPMIKYNPGNNRENIYRLYTANNISTNGKKIPFLYTYNNNKKALIIKLSKILSHNRRVSFLINITYHENNYDITCSIADNGTLYIDLPSIHDSMTPLSLQQIDEIIQIAIREPILDKIKVYLEQSGYSYLTFQNITEKNVEIQNITWVSQLKISTKIDLNKYISCLSTIFSIEKGSLKKSSEFITMRYKRVSSYNQMSAEKRIHNRAYANKIFHLQVLFEQLQSNFKLTKVEAELKMASWASEIKQRADLFENKKGKNNHNKCRFSRSYYTRCYK